MKQYLFILLFFPSVVYSQMPSWQTVDMEPPVNIEGMVTDSLGFLWLHDGDQLFRFDGVSSTSKLRLDDEKISYLGNAVNGNFILGTSNGRLISFNPYNASLKVIFLNEPGKPITGVSIIDESKFLVLSYGTGITLSVDGVNKNYTTDDHLISNEVYESIIYNEKYYISSDQGIQIIDPKSSNPIEKIITIADGLSDMVIPHLAEYNGEIWFTDYDLTLGKLTKDDEIVNYELTSKGKINSILPHESGLYTATENGLYLFKNDRFIIKSTDSHKLAQFDEEGNIWTVLSSGALEKGNLYFQNIKLSFSDIRAIESFKNEIIVGNEAGIYRKKKGSYTKVANENVTCLVSYQDYLLVGTFSEGVKIYNNEYKEVFGISNWNEINNESVLSIYRAGDEIFISSLTGVMRFSLKGQHLIPKQSLNPIVGQAYIYTMYLNGDKMYFGSDRDGLYIWQQGNDKITMLKEFDDGDKIGSVYCIEQDNTGQIWFTSSEHGLGFIRNNKAIKLEDVPNIKDEYTSLKAIHNGNLLLVRGNSIDILDPTTKHFMYFDKEVGIQDNITYLNNIVTEDKVTHFVHDNRLYTYESESNVKIHPEVIIDQKRVNLSIIDKERNRFHQEENNVEFDFQGSWLTDPQKLTYQYKLEGFEEEWRNTKDNSVSFPKLPPNQYLFRVRASENGRFHNEPEAQYRFEIKRYFYNLWWVRSIGLFFLGFLIYSIIKQREIRKKEQLELEKLNVENQVINLKNQLNPHFLFNSFNTLIGLIEENKDQSVVFVEKMSDFYRNMIEFGESDLISLADEKEVLLQYIDILKARFNGQLKIQFEWDDDLEQYLIPPLTLQLLVENAVKHNVVSTKNPLLLSINQTGNSILISNQKSPLLSVQPSTKTGLKNIKQRFQLMNLPTPIIRETDQTFEVELKLKKV